MMRALLLCLLVSCVAADTMEPSDLIGEPCTLGRDCLNGLCLMSLGDLTYPEGMCSMDCGTQPTDICGEGNICLTHNPTERSYCYQDCTEDAYRCREGYSCESVAFFTWACLPPLG